MRQIAIPLVLLVALGASAVALPATAVEGSPAIAFVGLADGASVGSTVPVRVDVSGFTLAPVGSSPNAADTGHIHYFVDGKPATGDYATTSTSFVFSGLVKGPRVLTAELVNNDHTPLSPQVIASRTVTVEDTSIEIVGLVENQKVGTAVPVSVTVKGFTFTPVKLSDIDANVPASGHIHYFVDGKPAASAVEGDIYASTATKFVYALSPGSHVITAELVNNDHTSFNPRVLAARTIVAGPAKVDLIGLADGAEVGTLLPLSVSVEGLVLGIVDLNAPKNVPGEGHLHFLVDGKPATGAVKAEIYATKATTFQVRLTPGTHEIRVELVNNDHSGLSPAVFATRTVTVVAPTIDFVDLAENAKAGTSLATTVAVKGFSLAPVSATPSNLEGQGHLHYFVDGKPATGDYATTSTSFTYALAPGSHVVTAELVNNDHSSLSPKVVASRTVTVAGPSVAFTNVDDGDKVGETFLARVEVEGFRFEPVKLENVAANEQAAGHLHFLVDGKPATSTVKDKLYATTEQEFAFLLTPGSHTLRAELVNNDHSGLSPAALDEVTVTVAGASAPAQAPTVDFVGLPDGFRVTGATLPVTVAVDGFSLAPVKLQDPAANAAATGHLHFLVDGKPAEGLDGAPYATNGTAFTFARLTPGAHVVRVELVNNDHSSLSPPVFEERTITVRSATEVAAKEEQKSVPGAGASFLLVSAGIAVAALSLRRLLDRAP